MKKRISLICFVAITLIMAFTCKSFGDVREGVVIPAKHEVSFCMQGYTHLLINPCDNSLIARLMSSAVNLDLYLDSYVEANGNDVGVECYIIDAWTVKVLNKPGCLNNDKMDLSVTKINVLGGKKQNKLDIQLAIQIRGDADRYKVWEKSSYEPEEWADLPESEESGIYNISLKLEPIDPDNKDYGATRTIQVKVANDSNESKPRKVKVTLMAPKITELSVEGGKKTNSSDLILRMKIKGETSTYVIWDVPPIIEEEKELPPKQGRKYY